MVMSFFTIYKIRRCNGAMIYYFFLLVSLELVTTKIKSVNYNTNNELDRGNINDHLYELTQLLNMGRQEHIMKVCNNLSESNSTIDQLNSIDLDHILVNPKHKLLYCYVPKVACTNWKRVLMVLEDKWNDTNVLGIPATLAHSDGIFTKLGSLSGPERISVLDTYQKLILVRHPFERLLSAYRNKLEGNSSSASYFQSRLGKKIVKLYRKNPSENSLERGHDVTFEEFIRFLTSKEDRLLDFKYNEHWQSINKLCHPCIIRYTLIGKYETILDDSMLALHTINASHIPFPNNIKTSGTASKLNAYYRKLPLDLIRNLFKLYEKDFRIFNYDLEKILGFELG